MHELHLSSVDLNLLVALDALLEERNVTRAADRIGVTQSAMSHALARLRTLLDDPLLVRAAGGMVATPRAESLGPPIRHALEQVRTALQSPSAFDPKTVKLRARVATSDYAELILLPRLVHRLEAAAPGIELRLLPHAADAAGPKLIDESFTCVVRRGHPLASQKLTLARFAAASHALISPRGKEGSFVDDALAKLGLSRRVAVAVPHFLVAPHIVAESDLVLTVASRVATLLAKPLGLVMLAPPRELELAGFRMSLLWHERTHHDAAHRWLRDLFVSVAGEIG